MKLVARLSLLVALVSATFAQPPHPINSDREIPLDDFPVLISGYRIQIGAFSSQKSADQSKQKLQSKLSAKVHLRQENSLWRVRVGDFIDSVSALKFMRSKPFSPWVKKAALVADQIPVSLDSSPTPPMVPGYRVQVYALADKDQALKSARNLTGLFPEVRIHVLLSDSLYKIQIGDFKDSTTAATFKESITGTADLKPFLVQMNVYDLPPPQPTMSAPKDIFKYDD